MYTFMNMKYFLIKLCAFNKVEIKVTFKTVCSVQIK